MNKTHKRRTLFVIIPIVILLLSAGTVWITTGKAQNLLHDGIYILAFKQKNLSFSESDLSILEKKNISFAYACQVYSKVSNGVCDMALSVIATNENYPYFSNMNMKTGGFFNGRQNNRRLKVAVINGKAAYQLFGNQNCIGEYIYLNQTPFEVIGIAAEEKNRGAKVYIPGLTLGGLELSDVKIEQVWCKFDNMADAALAVRNMGHSMEEMDILIR